MKKIAVNLRLDEEIVEKLDLLVINKNEINDKLAEELKLKIKKATRVDVVTQLIEFAIEKLEEEKGEK